LTRKNCRVRISPARFKPRNAQEANAGLMEIPSL
jgi:hypothetical protein